MFSITTVLLKDCREAGLIFCRRIVVDFSQKGAEEITLPYDKVLRLKKTDQSKDGYESFHYMVRCAHFTYYFLYFYLKKLTLAL